MTEKRKTVRKQIQMSEVMFNWYKNTADEVGGSVNGMFLMALKNFMDQQEALQASKQVPDWLSIAHEIQAQEREKVEGK